MGLLTRFRSDPSACDCRPSFDGDRLVVEADDCDGRGVLASAPDCRATVIDALTDRDVETVVTRADGLVRVYEDAAAALLVAAGRFVEAAGFHDNELATRARTDPLSVARVAAGRAGPVARIATESGLVEGAERAREYEDALRPFVGPTIARSRIAVRPPPDAEFVERTDLSSGAVVRLYQRPNDELDTYHVEPVETRLDSSATRTLEAANEALARGYVSGGERAAGRAVRRVASDDDPVETLVSVLRKHTHGNGVLDDLFSDPDCSDVFVTAPAGDTPLRVRVDGETFRTNVRFTDRGVETLASRFRRTSGRPFSRASPTLDAVTVAGDRRVRVAGVTAPASDGVAFAFRAHEREAWTLPALVANETVPAETAALLSLAVERDAACLVAGARGAGKTTTLGALCFELPAATRMVVIEDTAELPIEQLRRIGRDVQGIRIETSGGKGLTPVEALRTALRLGEGALVVGEVRGEEARALFEAMRVGANDSAVLGTVHGEGAEAVRERVTADLGVSSGAFGATDLVVTLVTTPNGRRIAAVEEVVGRDDAAFETLYRLTDDGLVATGRIDRGNSRLLTRLATPGETYADVRRALEKRTEWISSLAASGVTDAPRVSAAHARRRNGP